MTNTIDVSTFSPVEGMLDGTSWLFVIKSQDQLERRRRMLESRKGKKFGRIGARETAFGLLTKLRFDGGRVETETRQELREPRHIKRHPQGGFLVSEIDRVHHIDEKGKVKKTYTHPLFGFLHTVDVSKDGARMLVVSSGYDSLFEIDLSSGEETFRWVAWEHGFNPDEDGVWLAADSEHYARYHAEGKQALLIDPAEYGEQGLVTARRSAHPNVAVYNVYDGGRTILVSIGHEGALYRIVREKGEATRACDLLAQMPHGLLPYNGGWCMTNTVRGEWWLFDAALRPTTILTVAGLGGKVAGTEDIEWIQQVIPFGPVQALFLDANRGLIALDREARTYSVYQPDPNWCIQDALLLG